MQQDTKNKLLTGVIIGTGVVGALLLTSMQQSFERITKCQESAECRNNIGTAALLGQKAAPSTP